MHRAAPTLPHPEAHQPVLHRSQRQHGQPVGAGKERQQGAYFTVSLAIFKSWLFRKREGAFMQHIPTEKAQ